MSIVSKPNTFTAGTTAASAQVNSDFDTIYNDYNGNITDANIANSGITTYGKVNGAALSALGSINAGAGIIPAANLQGVATKSTFVNGDLVAHLLTVTHSLGLSAPYAIIVKIFNNSAQEIIPDTITGTANTFVVDLTSYGTLTGTWGYSYLKG